MKTTAFWSAAGGGRHGRPLLKRRHGRRTPKPHSQNHQTGLPTIDKNANFRLRPRMRKASAVSREIGTLEKRIVAKRSPVTSRPPTPTTDLIPYFATKSSCATMYGLP